MPYHGFFDGPTRNLIAADRELRSSRPSLRPCLLHLARSHRPASLPRRLHSSHVSRKANSLESDRRFHLRRIARRNPPAGAPPFSRSLREGGNFDSDVTPTTLFDLASLTKVVATTPTAMLLYERGLLDLDAPVSAIVPEFIHDAAKDPRRHEVTLRMLLSHSSGLPAYEKLFLKSRTRDELLQAAFTTPLAANPATRAELQRHRIHHPRHRPRARGRRIPRPLLPA